MAYTVPESELRFRVSRSSGPGGQHVNKTSTQVEVLWSVRESPSLTPAQRDRLQEVLAGRLGGNGRLRVRCGRFRSQKQNRDAAVERLRALVADALHVPKVRKKSAVPRAAREARLERKRRQAEKKTRRRPVALDD